MGIRAKCDFKTMQIRSHCFSMTMLPLSCNTSAIKLSRTNAHKNSQNIKRQSGVAAIEFAFIFPIFFLIFYAIITYGLILVAQQSITLAAAEGARAALRFAATETVRTNNARNAATGTGSAAAWLNGRLEFTGTLLASCPYNTPDINSRCYSVTVAYPGYRQNPLAPLLLGPLMGFTVPDRLASVAIVQIN